jgi:hypothetical protein
MGISGSQPHRLTGTPGRWSANRRNHVIATALLLDGCSKITQTEWTVCTPVLESPEELDLNRIPAAVALFALVTLGGMLAILDGGRARRSRVGHQTPSAPDVQAAEPTYVGRNVCLQCHRDNHQLHSRHGHATTFRSTDAPEVSEKFVGKTYDAGDPFGTYTYDADDQGLIVRLPDKFGDQPFRLEYALGHKSMTLLSLLPDPVAGTVGIEHRVSWLQHANRLGKTPGQRAGELSTAAEMFGARHQGKIMHQCVYCHVTTGEIVGQQIVGLTPNVNCEKCHGPGSEHVRQAKDGKTPPPFSVGRADWDTESELQLCGDCHRMPSDISRKQLRDYPDLLARFQPVGLLRSKCFLESEGQLTCTTCHNPHQSVSEIPAAEHEQNCLACHDAATETHVACPVSPSTGCVDCHMPSLELEGLGGGFHDHWIRIRGDR